MQFWRINVIPETFCWYLSLGRSSYRTHLLLRIFNFLSIEIKGLLTEMWFSRDRDIRKVRKFWKNLAGTADSRTFLSGLQLDQTFLHWCLLESISRRCTNEWKREFKNDRLSGQSGFGKSKLLRFILRVDVIKVKILYSYQLHISIGNHR